jgi:preprotein translocase subunit YajC
MHGKVVDLNDNDFSCVIETMAGKIKFDRTAISMEMSKKVNEPEKK